MEVGLEVCLDMLMLCAWCLSICILKHTRARTHARTHTRTHTHTHAYTNVGECVRKLVNFFQEPETNINVLRVQIDPHMLAISPAHARTIRRLMLSQ